MRVPRGVVVGTLLVVALAAVGVAAGVSQPWTRVAEPAAPGGATMARVGAPAPDIRLPLASGGTADLAADRGKVVLVNFWATWCEPCRAEMPQLQQLADQLQDQPFRLYSVDLQEDAASIEAFERELGLHLGVLIDQEGDVTRAYGVRALPATFLIDRQGMLRQQRLGPLLTGTAETAWSEPWLEGQVRSLLASS